MISEEVSCSNLERLHLSPEQLGLSAISKADKAKGVKYYFAWIHAAEQFADLNLSDGFFAFYKSK